MQSSLKRNKIITTYDQILVTIVIQHNRNKIYNQNDFSN